MYAPIFKYTYSITKCYLIFRLRAHRLVLGSASGFLKNVFRDIPQTLPEATILVPGVKRNVCQALVIIMIYRVYWGYQNFKGILHFYNRFLFDITFSA